MIRAPLRIAVIGAGIAGLGAAYRLARHHHVTLFEAEPRAGGHANTVDITLEGATHPVDTGFLVFNERTYPELIRLFSELRVPTVHSDMSFAVSVGPYAFEWCGSNLASVFAQPRNAISPRFWGMLRDIVRFNHQASALAQAPTARVDADVPLGAWLDQHRYGAAFRNGYLLPMTAAIWSCPTATMLDFPVISLARFCANHGLLQLTGRPRWQTVAGGARTYVQRIVAGLPDVRLATPVRAVLRSAAGRAADAPRPPIAVLTDDRRSEFDHVILACHSDQALALLPDADDTERAILGAIHYQPNRAYLHTDVRLMPRRRRAWAAWNYLSTPAHTPRSVTPEPSTHEVSVTYWLNRLQPLPFQRAVMVTLNPVLPPEPALILGVYDYAHPVFDRAACAAQKQLSLIQGQRQTWFAGAWTGYGFHEDGLRSGLAVADVLLGAPHPQGPLSYMPAAA
jgi:predicted NAD/FAD-binding protein